MNLILEQSNWLQIKAALENGKIKRAILVTGATENHGFHLPYGSDSLTPLAIAQKVMQHTDGSVLLPVLPYGMSIAHLGFPLTLSIRPEILSELYLDIFTSLGKHALSSILVINGHDGNIISLRQAGYKLKLIYPDIMLNIFEIWGVKLEKIFGSDQGAGHGGETETSVLLYLYPDLVNLEEAIGATITDNALIWTNKFIDEKTHSGATGNPLKATREHGEQTIQNAVNYLIQFLKESEKTE